MTVCLKVHKAKKLPSLSMSFFTLPLATSLILLKYTLHVGMKSKQEENCVAQSLFDKES